MSDKFAEIARQWMLDHCTTGSLELPTTLYHYTDAAGLVGMLRNGSVWATDYRFLNDKSELEHTRSIVTKEVKRRIQESTDDVLKNFYQRILRYQQIETPHDTFVFSLSEESDDLSQWRGYARDGQGFTIGFSSKIIDDGTRKEAPDYNFFKVEYDHDCQEQAVALALREIEHEVGIEAAKDGADVDKVCNSAAQNFDWLIEAGAPVNKHRSFKMENEWRVSTFIYADEKAARVKVRASGLRLVNYTEIKFYSEDGKLPITRIGIGPGFSNPEEVHAVRALCRETGYEPKIYYADTPFRRV